MDEIICYCKQVSKSEIEKAILDGAKTVKEIQEITGACTGNQCKEMNPSGECCYMEIFAILKVNKPKAKGSCCCCANFIYHRNKKYKYLEHEIE
ncbi:MAG TPA: (2Fe-2S)-binding protein [Paludibacter sp.]|nr:(2Fe-2S)-binding protein [Paludibacter sp.]